MSRDPFYLVKEDIENTVEQLEQSFLRWQNLPEGNNERHRLRDEIETNCESASLSLHELERLAILPVEKDPSKFNLDPSEVSGRRSWHSATRSKVARFQATLAEAARRAADRAAAKGGKNIPLNKLGGGGGGGGGNDALSNEAVRENDAYIQDERSRQQTLMKRQDQDLEDISQHVVRIGEMGKAIGGELDTQNKMLDDLDKDTDAVGSRLEAATRKITQVINKASGKTQMYIIIGLIIVLCILLFLVFI